MESNCFLLTSLDLFHDFYTFDWSKYHTLLFASSPLRFRVISMPIPSPPFEVVAPTHLYLDICCSARCDDVWPSLVAADYGGYKCCGPWSGCWWWWWWDPDIDLAGMWLHKHCLHIGWNSILIGRNPKWELRAKWS